MIEEDYVSFEVAKLLKEKGFDDEYTNAFYDKTGNLYFIDLLGDLSEHPNNDTDIAASTLYVVMKWLREVHNIFIDICVPATRGKYFLFNLYDIAPEEEWEMLPDDECTYSTYEQTAEAAIKYCLENLI